MIYPKTNIIDKFHDVNSWPIIGIRHTMMTSPLLQSDLIICWRQEKQTKLFGNQKVVKRKEDKILGFFLKSWSVGFAIISPNSMTWLFFNNFGHIFINF